MPTGRSASFGATRPCSHWPPGRRGSLRRSELNNAKFDCRQRWRTSPFVNAFRAPQLNSLRYNTSQFGSPVFIAYGTCRVSVNIVKYWGFSGSSGGGKGGKGLGRSAGKKGSNQRYQVNVAFGLCQGPVSFAGASHGSDGSNRIWSNGGIANGLSAVGLNGYAGCDGQDPDPVFLSTDPNPPTLGYSGTCYVTGTPMELGSSPVLPNMQFEVTGFEVRKRRSRIPG